MEVVVEVSTAAAAADAADADADAAEGELDDTSAAAAAGGSYSRRWLHRAIAHFIMVLRPTGSSSSSSSSGGGVVVPAVVPGTELEQLHFDAGGRGWGQALQGLLVLTAVAAYGAVFWHLLLCHMRRAAFRHRH
jgi:hypothetical protein